MSNYIQITTEDIRDFRETKSGVIKQYFDQVLGNLDSSFKGRLMDREVSISEYLSIDSGNVRGTLLVFEVEGISKGMNRFLSKYQMVLVK